LSESLNVRFAGPQVYRNYPGTELHERFGAHFEYGDLNSYLVDLDVESGVEVDLVNKYEGLFFSEFIMFVFNRRYSPHRLYQDEQGRWRLKKARAAQAYRLGNLGISILMIPLMIRLRLNFWKFFIDPPIIGFLYFYLRKVYQLFSRLFGSGQGAKVAVPDDEVQL
jgi:hypothetical protein